MRYYSFNRYLKERFGERVHKVALDAGRSCPNRDGSRATGGCIYCNSRGSGTGAWRRCPDVRAQAQAGIDVIARRYGVRRFIAYFQSFSNTYGPLADLRELYESVLDLPGIVGLSVSTRPDCLNPEILNLLAGYTDRLMVWLELGLQSIHEETLEHINRGHTYGDFLKGFQLARQYPLLLCVHVIIGLPGEQPGHVLQTAREVARLRPDGIKIHSLYIPQGTALEQLYRDGLYVPLAQQEFAGLACDFLELLPPDTVVQRLTGDPQAAELVAPDWARYKQATLNLIAREMELRQSRQGIKHQPE
jgi:hypothetical protein